GDPRPRFTVRATRGSRHAWRAGCGETRTSGSERGMKKPASETGQGASSLLYRKPAQPFSSPSALPDSRRCLLTPAWQAVTMTANADVEAKLKMFTGAACLPQADHLSIQYDREHPDDIVFYGDDDNGSFPGRLLISIGVIAMGSAYFLW